MDENKRKSGKIFIIIFAFVALIIICLGVFRAQATGSFNTTIYKKYGLKYNSVTDYLIYEGKKVRYFEDNQALEDSEYSFQGVCYSHDDGEIDVIAVRDSDGKLIGLESFDFENTPQRIVDFFENAKSGSK